MVQERDEFRLTFSFEALTVDFARPRVEGGKELQRPASPIFMFNVIGHVTRCRRTRGVSPGLRLKRRFFIDAQHDLIFRKRPDIEVDYLFHAIIKFRIPWR